MYLKVTPEYSGQRLDKFCKEQISEPDLSRSAVSKWIKQGNVLLNGKVCFKPACQINAGDQLEIHKENISREIEPRAGKLDINYQDPDLAVINKPPGLNVNPAPSESETTLVNYLLYQFPEFKSLDPERPGIVHRLDKDTSGLLLLGKNSETVHRLSRDIFQRNIRKEYLAVVHGVLDSEEGEIDLPIGRDPGNRTRMKVLPGQGKDALSKYRLLHVFPGSSFSLLKIRIVTGRTHQIRVHLSHVGCPVLGDALYARKHLKQLKKDFPTLSKLVNRQMLHAWKIGMFHPSSGSWLHFKQQVPGDFKRVLLQLQRSVFKVGIVGSSKRSRTALLHSLSRRGLRVQKQDFCELFEPGAQGWEMFQRSLGQKYFAGPEKRLDKQKFISSLCFSENFEREVNRLFKPLAEYWLKGLPGNQQGRDIVVTGLPVYFVQNVDCREFFDVLVFFFCIDRISKKGLNWEDIRDSSIECAIDDLCTDKKTLLSRVDLIVGCLGSDSELESKSRDLKALLERLKRKRVRDFKDWLIGTGVI